MSVLCRHPLDAGEVSEEFPFATFVDLSNMLVRSLVSGGLLMIYNVSYRSSETPAASGFRVVRSPMVESTGWIPV